MTRRVWLWVSIVLLQTVPLSHATSVCPNGKHLSLASRCVSPAKTPHWQHNLCSQRFPPDRWSSGQAAKPAASLSFPAATPCAPLHASLRPKNFSHRLIPAFPLSLNLSLYFEWHLALSSSRTSNLALVLTIAWRAYIFSQRKTSPLSPSFVYCHIVSKPFQALGSLRWSNPSKVIYNLHGASRSTVVFTLN